MYFVKSTLFLLDEDDKFLLELLDSQILHTPHLENVRVILLQFLGSARSLSHNHSDLGRFLLLRHFRGILLVVHLKV